MIHFPPPPFVFALLLSLEETGTDQANPTLGGLQNWFWRAHSMVRFPPPPQQNRTIRIRFPIKLLGSISSRGPLICCGFVCFSLTKGPNSPQKKEGSL